MITYVQGNLLDAPVEALVNTVNTVGVMGKGIALMFKERFPTNTRLYVSACKHNQINVGKMFVTETGELNGPRWIINFPTKQHWRGKSQMSWIEQGLIDLCQVIKQNQIHSIAIPPLGAGNGGLNWAQVKIKIESILSNLEDTDILIYEPTSRYQNIAKSSGAQKLTPPRALIAELVRRYWILGMECSLLEIQKLSWFLYRVSNAYGIEDELHLQFKPHKYGPYAHALNHLLNALDGSYLKSDKRIPDCAPTDVIYFNESTKDNVQAYLNSEAKDYLPVLQKTTELIDGFESPFGMELLASVDWLISSGYYEPTLDSIKKGLHDWPAGGVWGERKTRLFNDETISFAISQLQDRFYNLGSLGKMDKNNTFI